jgi:hypothetical protein
MPIQPWIILVENGKYVLSLECDDSYYSTNLTVYQRHGLAAYCLHDQPFGFTWEDVARIRANCEGFRWVASQASEHAAKKMHAEITGLLDLADRLEALLAPRNS